MNHTARGFTIVELIVVIVVIAILASLTIASFSGIQNRANDSAVQTDLRNYFTAMEIFKADNNRYPQTAAELNSLNVKISKGSYRPSPYQWPVKYCFNANNYALGAESKSGSGYYISTLSGSGVTKRPTANSATDWCRDDYGFKDAGNNATYTYAAWRDASFDWRGGAQTSAGGSTNN